MQLDKGRYYAKHQPKLTDISSRDIIKSTKLLSVHVVYGTEFNKTHANAKAIMLSLLVQN